MNIDASIVPYLFLVTLVIGLGIGVYQIFKVRKARQEHRRSEQAKVHHEPYAAGHGSGSGRPQE
jgi:F0F1-type ATP synthase assembly protein I